MEDNQCIVSCYMWQFQCCGDIFKIGDKIEWEVTPSYEINYNVEVEDKTEERISKELYDCHYWYEGCAGGSGILTGTVDSIKAFYCEPKRISDRVTTIGPIMYYKNISTANDFFDSTPEGYKLEYYSVILKDVNYCVIEKNNKI